MSNEEEPQSGAAERGAPLVAPPKPETNSSLGLAIVLALALLIGMAYLWNHEKGDELPQTMLFLGQFHPVAVHLPITLLLVVFVMECLSMFKPWRGLRKNTLFLLWLATLGAAVAIVVGYMLRSSGEYSGERIDNHMWAGFGVAAGSLAALMLKSGIGETLLYRFVLLLTVCTVVIAGHLGGSVTHGSDYLTKHMPASWSAHPFFNGGGFWGYFGQNGNGSGHSDVAAAPGGTVYDLYIHPIMSEHCTECHGDAKQKGKLRLDTHDFVMMGADDGEEPVVVPGKPEASELIARLLLPVEDDDVMPPEDEPRLKDDEIFLLQWWIKEGASKELTVASVRADEEQAGAAIIRILKEREPAAAVDPAVAAAKDAAEKAEQDRAETEAAQRVEMRSDALRKIEERGFTLRPISAVDEGLQFNAVNVADTFDDGALVLFEPVAGDIVELDLARTKITDEGAAALAKMTGLTSLHLENTAITDAALAHLMGLDKLEYLNLYGTKVTDAGLARLESLAGLKRVFLWQTEVTEEGAEKLRKAKPGLYVDMGWKEPPVAVVEKEEEKKKEDAEPVVKPETKVESNANANAKPKVKVKGEAKAKTKAVPAAEEKKPEAKPAPEAVEEKKPAAKAGGEKNQLRQDAAATPEVKSGKSKGKEKAKAKPKAE